MSSRSRIPDIVTKFDQALLKDWIEKQLSSPTLRADMIKESELREQSQQFLSAFRQAIQNGISDINSAPWKEVRSVLESVSRARALQGFSPVQTATFVFSLKQPLFALLRKEWDKDGQGLAEDTWNASTLIDDLGLYTTGIYQKSREDVIARQQRELLELSTPVVELWDNILALPLIGTLDSSRTQVVMESLLEKIVETGARIAIIDITGVPTVDTLVAQHLMKTVAAARLMGGDCIISGIRPQIAQTIVHLGVNLTDIVTKASLADAFAVALQRLGASVTRTTPSAST